MNDIHSSPLEVCKIYNITRKTFLGKIHTLTFDYKGVVDILTLDNSHKQNPNHCRIPNLTDTNIVHTLSIAHTLIENIDSSVNVLDLNVSHTNVFNIFPLTSIQIILTTQGCWGVQHITNLHMKNCDDIIDLSFFKKLNTLSIIKCTKVININMLTELSHVTIEGTDIDDISCLGDVKYLLLSNLNNITNFPVFKNAKRVSLFGFAQTPTLTISGNVKQFVIDVFKNLMEIYIDGNIKNLNLMCLPDLKNVFFSDEAIIENVLVCECSKTTGKKFAHRAKNIVSECLCRD
jgi:hypothetical protein